MKILKDILYKVSIEAVKGATDIAVNKITFDSRAVELNDVFVAIKGSHSDGHDYIEKALSLGATEFGISSAKNKRFYVIYNGKKINFGFFLQKP